jgi:hypothetical protein
MRWIPPRIIEKYARRKCHFTEIFVFPFFLRIAIIPVMKNRRKTTTPRYTTKGIPSDNNLFPETYTHHN